MDANGQLHTPAALLQGKEAPVPVGQEAGVGPKAGLDAVERSLCGVFKRTIQRSPKG
jgi:hypothetical protein